MPSNGSIEHAKTNGKRQGTKYVKSLGERKYLFFALFLVDE